MKLTISSCHRDELITFAVFLTTSGNSYEKLLTDLISVLVKHNIYGCHEHRFVSFRGQQETCQVKFSGLKIFPRWIYS